MAESLQMLTPKDVAEILGVHQKTVHLWLRAGKLNGIKISYRAWRIPQSALNAFIEQKSNVQLLNRVEGIKGTGEEELARLTTESTSTPSIQNHDTPQSKMKHYIRDIMGEQSLENPIKEKKP
jgi:excisionase family DNA binding protein